ncbi:MAG TPA: ABC transporter permease, partial [Chryseosolibacter sp.]|nr:ABC transporter permease [Chryseosolibacter sp.]
MNKDIKVYTPESSITKPRVLLGEMWKDLLQSRDLAWRLAVRDFSALYRQSLLGVLWVFILPLANTITWIFLRSSGVVAVADTDVPYPVYVFTGTMIWSIFTESVQAPLQKVTASKNLLTKINFPREALLLSSFYQLLFNSAVKVILMLVAMLALGYNFVDYTFALFPLAIISMILCGMAIGLLLTPIGLLYTDIGKGLPIVMQFLMYLSPVVFPIPKEGWIATFISYNPLTPLVVTSRAWLTGNPTAFLQGFLEVNLGLMAVLFFGWVLYRAAMPIL